jgi:hypothetical protein
MFVIQVLLYLLAFTASIVAVVTKGPVGGLFFYPKDVQKRALELGLIDAATLQRRKDVYFVALMLILLLLPVLFIGLWNGVTAFSTAFLQAFALLAIMNWYDGIVMDLVWVGHSKFWAIPGCEDLTYTKSIKAVLVKRTLATLVYVPVAALLGEVSVLVANAI